MEHRAFFTARVPTAACGEALRDWFLDRGWWEETEEEQRAVFRRPFRLLGVLGWRIEDLPTRLDARWSARAGDGEETMVSLYFVVDARFRLWSHLDRLYYQLEVEALEHFVATGVRVEPTEELDRVRRPVAIAVMLNVVTAAALTTAAATVIDLGLVASLLISLGVALINFVSILGFADLLVAGMDDLGRFRARLETRRRDQEG